MQNEVRTRRESRKVMENKPSEAAVSACRVSKQAVRKVRNLALDKLYNELNDWPELAKKKIDHCASNKGTKT